MFHSELNYRINNVLIIINYNIYFITELNPVGKRDKQKTDH